MKRTPPPALPRDIPAVRSPYLEPDLYDLLFDAYRDDLEFYTGLAVAAGGPVLEIACGTGRVMLPALAAGADIEGLDIEPGMLETLRARAAARGLAARAHLADMRAFAMPRPYAVILSPFNAMAHNLTSEDQIATLAGCHEHLRPGGRLVFDVQAMSLGALCEPDGVRLKALEVPGLDGGRALRLWDTRFKDAVSQTQRSLLEVEELDVTGGVLVSHRFETTVRWMHKNELELLLSLAGFAYWEIDGGFHDEPLEAESGQMVVKAWKAGG